MFYIIATPIGNLADITLRALEALKQADVILCEDTRRSAILLQHYGILGKTLWTYHDRNAQTQRPKILKHLQEGKTMALISDAGTPLIADPGYKLIRLLHEHGIPVTSLPGACAAITALTLSGMPSDRFLFAGFFDQERFGEVREIPCTLIFYESANRLPETLKWLSEAQVARPVAVARELTKRFETVIRGSIEEVRQHFAEQEAIKGEIVLILGPEEEGQGEKTRLEWEELLRSRLRDGQPIKEVCTLIAKTYGLARKTVYAKALEIAGKNEEKS